MDLYNRNSVKGRRKELRNNSTPAEIILWKYLKHSALEGIKFRRQNSIGSYIIDFYAPSEKLAIELDGNHHFTEEGLIYDERRDAFLRRLDIKVLRFENKDVLYNIEWVLNEIKKVLKK